MYICILPAMGWLGFLMMLMVIHALRGMNTIPFQDIDKEGSCCPLHGLDADANSWSKRRANMLCRVEFQGLHLQSYWQLETDEFG